MRSIAIMITVGMLTGCQGTAPKSDPFFGRQLIAPPPMVGSPGQAPAGGNAPYYPGDQTSSSPPASGGGGSPLNPPGGFDYGGYNPTANTASDPSGFRPPSTVQSPPASTTPRAAGLPVRSTNPADSPPRRDPPADDRYRDLNYNNSSSQPKPDSQAAFRELGRTRATFASTTTTGNSSQPAQPPVDIMQLPATRQGAAIGFRPPSSVRSAGYREEVEDPRKNAFVVLRNIGQDPEQPRLFDPGDVPTPIVDNFYGHSEGYQLLRGKIELSGDEGYWQLRYQPLDGPQDAVGGVVRIRESSLLDGIEPGSFVTAYGRLKLPQRGSRELPFYELRQIDPQFD